MGWPLSKADRRGAFLFYIPQYFCSLLFCTFRLICQIPPTIAIEVTFLGTGTSQGVPVIGCNCKVCNSDDPRDHRLRTSVLLKINGKHILIDCGPDFRQQMLRADVSCLDAIVLTHEHNDHIIGLDDVRPFNFYQRKEMPVFATDRVAIQLRKRFEYIFAAQRYPGAPMITIRPIQHDLPFEVEGILLTPIEVLHGKLPILGFRIEDFTYLTDVKTISEPEIRKLKGTHTLVINALHHEKHYSHLNLEEAINMIAQIGPKRAYLIHISHRMGLYQDVARSLPSHIKIAYDGLVVKV